MHEYVQFSDTFPFQTDMFMNKTHTVKDHENLYSRFQKNSL